MKKTRQIFAIKAIILLILLAASPAVFSASTETIANDKNDSISDTIPRPGAPTVYVGDMYVEGTGDYETSIVMATAEKDLIIKIKPGGTDVIIEARYLLQCPGLWDGAQAQLWVSRADGRKKETSDYAEGYLYTTAYDCEVGDTIGWSLTAVYDDFFFPGPIIDYDIGGGLFTLKYSRSETSTPLFIQILQKLMDKCPLLMQLVSQLIDRITLIKGTITFE